jgi:hypothetical protein
MKFLPISDIVMYVTERGGYRMKKLIPILICIGMAACARTGVAQDEKGSIDTEQARRAPDVAAKPADEELLNLVEAAKEAARPVTAAPQPAAAETAQPAAGAAPQAPAAVEEKPPALAGSYDGSALGYMIRFPADWVYDTPSGYQVVFSGKQGSPAYYAMVTIQNLLSAKQGGRYKDVSEVSDGVIGQLNQEASAVKIHDEKQFVYTMKDGAQLRGMEFKADYARQDKKFRQWVIIIPRPSGETFYVWSYTAPDDLYDTYYGTVQLMLDSWVIS